LPEVYPASLRGFLQACIAALPLPLATLRLRPRKLSGIYDRLGMDFARYLCHNAGHHQLAAGPCPAHNPAFGGQEEIMAQSFNTIKFEEQLGVLEDCNTWMIRKIGLNVTDTRFDYILNLLRIIVDRYRQDKVQELMKQYDEATLFFALTDASSYIKIFNFFKDKKSHEIPRGKLTESINGPILPWEEEPDKGTAHNRNISFELETAIWFHKSGIEIENFDDVQFLFDRHTFNVQCKRIHSPKRIADNIENAAQQISKRMENGEKMKGIICLCIDKLTEKEGWILQVDHEDEVGPNLDNSS